MELRLYSFVNFYLSSIQQGIQTGHAAVDLVRKYEENYAHPSDDHIKLCDMVIEWADDYKTFIILNGGDNEAIGVTTNTIRESGFPFSIFMEPGIGGCQTCVTVVLPESIFNARHRDPDFPEPVYQYVDLTTTQITAYYPGHRQYELIKLLKASKLAS